MVVQSEMQIAGGRRGIVGNQQLAQLRPVATQRRQLAERGKIVAAEVEIFQRGKSCGQHAERLQRGDRVPRETERLDILKVLLNDAQERTHKGLVQKRRTASERGRQRSNARGEVEQFGFGIVAGLRALPDQGDMLGRDGRVELSPSASAPVAATSLLPRAAGIKLGATCSLSN